MSVMGIDRKVGVVFGPLMSAARIVAVVIAVGVVALTILAVGFWLGENESANDLADEVYSFVGSQIENAGKECLWVFSSVYFYCKDKATLEAAAEAEAEAAAALRARAAIRAGSMTCGQALNGILMRFPEFSRTSLLDTPKDLQDGAIGIKDEFHLMSMEQAAVKYAEGVPSQVLIVTVNPQFCREGGFAFAMPEVSSNSILVPHKRDEEIDANRYTIEERVFMTQLVAAATVMYEYLQDSRKTVYAHCDQGINQAFLACVVGWGAMRNNTDFDAVMSAICELQNGEAGYNRDTGGFFGSRFGSCYVRAHPDNYDLVQCYFGDFVRTVRGDAELPMGLGITADKLRTILPLPAAGGGDGGGSVDNGAVGDFGGEYAAAADSAYARYARSLRSMYGSV